MHEFIRDVVIFNGIEFRRYPNSKSSSDRNYFRPGSQNVRAGVQALHREIWKAAHGNIPDGCDIHHKDENPLNNNVDNLECLPKAVHAELHAATMPAWRRQWIAKDLDTYARPAASQWHKSDEGRAWHVENGRHSAALRVPSSKTCEVCGVEFETKAPHQARFCSGNCRATARRRSGVDNETRVCLMCGNGFTVHRYNKTMFCGNSCCTKYHWLKPDTKYK